MKVRTASEFAQRSLRPALPSFDVNGRLLYRRPVADILCGFYIEDSSFDASSFAVHAFVLPLYVPTDHLYLSFGKRLGAGSGQWWDYTREREAEVADAVLKIIVSQGIPLLEPYRDAEQFYRNAAVLMSNPRGLHLLEAQAYSALRAGLVGDGKAALDALAHEFAQADPSLVYVTDMRNRALRLRQSAEESSDAVQRILDEYRQLTMDQLKLSD